jgi:hypothetical protein
MQENVVERFSTLLSCLDEHKEVFNNVFLALQTLSNPSDARPFRPAFPAGSDGHLLRL